MPAGHGAYVFSLRMDNFLTKRISFLILPRFCVHFLQCFFLPAQMFYYAVNAL